MDIKSGHDEIQKMADVEIGSPLARVRARGKFNDADVKDFVPTPESTFLYVDTPNYDGPLDLLLHLIRKHSMDIFDIPIVDITHKYLAALDEMNLLNLDVAGEFLVMAATLAEIKSKMLLPKEERTTVTEEEEEDDPRALLIKRLLLYKSFQEASLELMSRPQNGRDWFMRPAPEEELQKDITEDTPFHEISIASVEIHDLLESLHKVLKKSEHVNIHTVTQDRISVSARIHELLDFCQVRNNFTFYDALGFFTIYEKIDVIVTFLALLEMSRLKLLKIKNIDHYELAVTIVKEHFYAKEILHNIDGKTVEADYE